jgi:hypothetical protein
MRMSSKTRFMTSVYGRRFPIQEVVTAHKQRIDRLLDLALEDSFPASDPISTMRSSGPWCETIAC